MPSPQPSLPSPGSTSSASTPPAPRSGRTRVSAEHTLNRVRENQRRHRARQRDHVASLEQKLAETEALLAEARAEIASLKEQQQQSGCVNRQHQPVGQCAGDEDRAKGVLGVEHHPSSFMRRDGGEESHMNLDIDISSTLSLSLSQPHQPQPPSSSPSTPYDIPFLPSPPPFYLPLSPTSSLSLLTSLSSPLSLPADPLPSTGPPPCCTDPDPIPTPLSPADPECTTCKTRPPPSPTESTTLCAQAYVMISQQNFRNLDPDTIRLWLAQGLRRAQREGEGCRVENGALMRLLDFISGV